MTPLHLKDRISFPSLAHARHFMSRGRLAKSVSTSTRYSVVGGAIADLAFPLRRAPPAFFIQDVIRVWPVAFRNAGGLHPLFMLGQYALRGLRWYVYFSFCRLRRYNIRFDFLPCLWGLRNGRFCMSLWWRGIYTTDYHCHYDDRNNTTEEMYRLHHYHPLR